MCAYTHNNNNNNTDFCNHCCMYDTAINIHIKSLRVYDPVLEVALVPCTSVIVRL